MNHELKTWPEQFDAVVRGFKTVELCKDDRSFCILDTLLLREWDPKTQEYTGRESTRLVTHILRGGPWLEEGYCALSLVDEAHVKRHAKLERLWETAKRWRAQMLVLGGFLVTKDEIERERKHRRELERLMVGLVDELEAVKT